MSSDYALPVSSIIQSPAAGSAWAGGRPRDVRAAREEAREDHAEGRAIANRQRGGSAPAGEGARERPCEELREWYVAHECETGERREQ